MTFKEMELETLEKALCASGGHQGFAALLMGTTLKTVKRWVSDNNLVLSNYKEPKKRPYECKILVKAKRIKK